MAEGPRKFGRYFLLDLLAQGGMAEIYRARLASQEGAGRLLVIKRIMAGYGENVEFLSMFKSEIKVTMGFNHPNIVQLYDFGEESGQPYIAMEYVDGKNVRQFMSRFLELKQRFPVDLAVHIIEQAASGLHYAHAFRDKISGESLSIVHRDISPQNLLLSYEGSVKVIDFGIAKATTNSEATRAGVIKGKPSYLSPEQINGDNLDGRSDLFSLGAVLWELLAGKKLFAGDNDLAILKLIESCQTYVKPPSTINPAVPPELDYIVLKSLAKQRDKRYANAEEFQRALHKFLYAYAPDFNPSDLGYHAKDLFKKEIVDDRKRIQKVNDEVEKLIASPHGISPPAPPVVMPEFAGVLHAEVEIPDLEDTPEPTSATSVVMAPPKAPVPFEVFANNSVASETHVVIENRLRANQQQQPLAPSLQAQPSAPLGITEGLPVLAPHSKSRPTTRQIAVRNGSQSVANAAFDRPEGSSWIGKLLVAGVAAAVLVVFFGKHVGITLPFLIPVLNGRPEIVKTDRAVASKPPEPQASLSESLLPHGAGEIPSVANARDRTIQLRLNVTPGGGAVVLKVGSPSVEVNGKILSADNPVVTVPLDQTLELIAERNGYKRFRVEFFVDSREVGALKQWSKDVPMEPNQFGYLSVHTTPNSDAFIAVDEGKPWLIKTPFENIKVPVGTYSIRFVNELLGMEKKVTVKIEDNKILNLDERLEIKD
jgi:serine/threonine-protein kinase